MSNKGHQIHEWIAKERLKLYVQNKLVLPSIQERQQQLRLSILKKNQKEQLQKEAKELKLTPQLKRKHLIESRIGTLNESNLINDQKNHILWQIKEWIKILETNMELTENHLSKLKNSLYKWLDQMPQHLSANFTTSVISQSTSTQIHAKKLAQDYERKIKQQKLFFQKQMKKIQAKFKDSQQILQVNNMNSHQSLAKIQQLKQLFIQCKQLLKKRQEKGNQMNLLINLILNQNEQFIKELQYLIASKKQISKFTQKIDQQLINLKEYKDKFYLIQ